MSVRGNRTADPAWGVGDVLDLLAIVLAVGLIVLIRLGAAGAPRLLLSLGFAIFVPGRAIVTNWPGMQRWSEAAMSMVFSLTILTLVATVTLWAGYWHPVGLFQIEAVLSLAALGAGMLRRHRHRAAASRPGL